MKENDRVRIFASTALTIDRLSVLDDDTPNPFTNLSTHGAAFSVTGTESTLCPGSTEVPMIGVIVKQYDSSDGPIVATTPTVEGVFPLEGAILYDPS